MKYLIIISKSKKICGIIDHAVRLENALRNKGNTVTLLKFGSFFPSIRKLLSYQIDRIIIESPTDNLRNPFLLWLVVLISCMKTQTIYWLHEGARLSVYGKLRERVAIVFITKLICADINDLQAIGTKKKSLVLPIGPNCLHSKHYNNKNNKDGFLIIKRGRSQNQFDEVSAIIKSWIKLTIKPKLSIGGYWDSPYREQLEELCFSTGINWLGEISTTDELCNIISLSKAVIIIDNLSGLKRSGIARLAEVNEIPVIPVSTQPHKSEIQYYFPDQIWNVKTEFIKQENEFEKLGGWEMIASKIMDIS